MTKQPDTQVHKHYLKTDWIDFSEWGIDLTRGVLTGEDDNVQTRFWTALKEPAQHCAIPADSIALGPFDAYDLQLAFDEPHPPTLLARYGQEDDAYEAFNSETGMSIDDASPAIREAFRRARALGWGDELKAH